MKFDLIMHKIFRTVRFYELLLNHLDKLINMFRVDNLVRSRVFIKADVFFCLQLLGVYGLGLVADQLLSVLGLHLFGLRNNRKEFVLHSG